MTDVLLRVVLPVVGGLLLVWLVLVVALWVARPGTTTLRDALRLLPDVARMVRGVATDRAVPRGCRVALWLLLAYLASPVDLVPDVVPVLGWADDAVVVVLVLRAVARRAGADTLTRHWPGSAEGLAVVLRLAGVAARPTPSAPTTLDHGEPVREP
ncbi:DUF1232 domain-containing protein [Cellulomonas triticagri]|uniref:DUF1232 domain-containing protein n=1 Tax=Cellulomonas triticagri TaxID=2483352 RepID=UPI0018F5EDA0|nr:DUF1232 domain-containing protein [Cellulomonas triticagri]